MISVLDRVSRGINVGHKTIIGFVIFRVGGVYFYHFVVYSLGDKKHINQLVDNLAKEPESFKSKNYIAMNSMGAGALFSYFCMVYPLVRHRRREKKCSSDIFMCLNWLFFMTAFCILLS
ncbi:hypothetical protein [Vibrio ostreicida]|uniref:hypothetical protein n=1 Tax=Vibrio ostreicida TaxID=526588 RepID=UPI001FE5E0C3|nr:hypothetical protein [Vibrio ostreicida]